jgi:hypothetical protein
VKEMCTPFKKNLPIITCECGAEILLVQKVEIVGRAIDNHVKEHRARALDPVEANAVSKRIEDHLIKQVLDKAAKQ